MRASTFAHLEDKYLCLREEADRWIRRIYIQYLIVRKYSEKRRRKRRRKRKWKIPGNLDRHESNRPVLSACWTKRRERRQVRFVISIARLSQDEADLQGSENRHHQIRNKVPLRHSVYWSPERTQSSESNEDIDHSKNILSLPPSLLPLSP